MKYNRYKDLINKLEIAMNNLNYCNNKSMNNILRRKSFKIYSKKNNKGKCLCNFNLIIKNHNLIKVNKTINNNHLETKINNLISKP